MSWKTVLFACTACFLFFLIGVYTGFRVFDWGISEVQLALMNETMSEIANVRIAWTEKPLSDKRVIFRNEFCYEVDGVAICPKRNITGYLDDISK